MFFSYDVVYRPKFKDAAIIKPACVACTTCIVYSLGLNVAFRPRHSNVLLTKLSLLGVLRVIVITIRSYHLFHHRYCFVIGTEIIFVTLRPTYSTLTERVNMLTFYISIRAVITASPHSRSHRPLQHSIKPTLLCCNKIQTLYSIYHIFQIDYIPTADY